MNENNIIDALNAYDGTQPSLEKTVSVLSEEIGPDWANQVFEKLGNLPVDLKEKLDHAFNYYASLTAWQEAQSYLNQSEPLDPQMMEERLPVLEHWLEFFGQPGQDLYHQLEEYYQQQLNPSDSQPTDGSTSENSLDDEVDLNINDEQAASNQEEENNPEDISEPVQPDSSEVDSSLGTEDLQQDEIEEDQPNNELQDDNVEEYELDENKQENTEESSEPWDQITEKETPEVFAIRKAEREIALLDSIQAWLAARCIELGNIETFAYPYYGMVVDLMRQVVKSIQTVLDFENKDIISQCNPGGLDFFTRKKEAIESDIETAVENCESSTTALIEKGMDMDTVKKALGDLDNSTEKEYLGPAPDGFELMDDAPIDEEAVKEEYEKLEENVQKNNPQTDILTTEEKKTSQNDQNGVQRKLSFSLKPKKG